MKRRSIIFALVTIILGGLVVSIAAQGPRPKTSSRMEYHGGSVLVGSQDVYFIWYGCWTDNCGNFGSTTTTELVTHFASSLGGSPYYQLLQLYDNDIGQRPSGALFYGGSVFQPTYTHGLELTETDIEDIVRQHIENHSLPQDPLGIYIVMTSANVAAADSTGFCSTANTPPLHGRIFEILGAEQRYGFVGNSNRCPSVEAPQFMAPDGNTRLPTPNNDFAGDAMVARLAHVLNNTVTNPNGNGWYDRYGLETADKCQGTFGQTYTTPNGARANIRLGGRDFLIGQNWVNDRKGRCGMQLSQ